MLTFLGCLLTLGGWAQELKPAGGFLQDSLKLGEPVPYYLALSYPQDLDVVFPDSLYNFAPFELDHKEYYPTKTINGISYDSAVYYLSTFEVDTVQYLALPVFQVTGGDSIPLKVAVDTVILKQVVKEIPDSVAVEAMPLRENTNYINVPLQFNYPYLILGVSVLLIAFIVVYVLLGNRIRRRWQLYRLEKKHRKFQHQFESLLQEKQEPARKHAEEVILFWKRYLEKLEDWPYTRSTSRDLVRTGHGQELQPSLAEIDRIIYGNREVPFRATDFEPLKAYADDRFKRRTEALRHG